MKIAKLKGQRRKLGGRHANERLRRAGQLPAVIYGHKVAPEHVALPRHELELALHAQAHVLEVDLDGKPEPMLIKEVQYDHLQRTPMHVDLMRIDPNERVRVKIPVHLVGTPKGVREGGELVVMISDIEVECPALRIPDDIRINIADLAIGGHLYVRDLTLPADVTPSQRPEDHVCLVRTKKEVVEAAPAAVEGEAAAEPEVITKGKGEEGEAEAEGGAAKKPEAPKK